MSREEARCFTTVISLTKMLTSFLLFIIELVFYVFAGIVVYLSISPGLLFAEGIMFACFMAFLARMIRIARFEIDRIDNDNYLMNVSMLVIALVTLLITVVGLFISSHNSGG